MPRGSCVTPGIKRARSVNRLPFTGRSVSARSSRTSDTALGWVSTSGGAPETVTVSLLPANPSSNSRSMAPPTSTWICGATCGDIPSVSARVEYSPGVSNSNPNRPSSFVVLEATMPLLVLTKVTEAPTIRFPSGSTTQPRIAPVEASCARESVFKESTKTSIKKMGKNASRRMGRPSSRRIGGRDPGDPQMWIYHALGTWNVTTRTLVGLDG
jgi:hypothetical protein